MVETHVPGQAGSRPMAARSLLEIRLIVDRWRGSSGRHPDGVRSRIVGR